MEDEKENDRELALVLQGKSNKVRSKLNILKYMIQDKGIRNPGLITAGGGSGIVSFAHLAQVGLKSPDEATLILFGQIIASAVGIMLVLSYDTYRLEESRRKGKGKLGRLLEIPK